jgi:phosphotransferase system HPr (HPr) family protein
MAPPDHTAMNGQTLKQTVRITNPQGFHMRPVTLFAQQAARFVSNVTVSRDNRSVNGKSPWDLMLMLSPPGSELTVEVEGPDAPEALAALVALLTQPPDAGEQPANAEGG